MSKTNLLLTDCLFAISIALLLYSSGGKLTLPLTLMLIIALGGSINSHVNHYKRTKRIF